MLKRREERAFEMFIQDLLSIPYPFFRCECFIITSLGAAYHAVHIIPLPGKSRPERCI